MSTTTTDKCENSPKVIVRAFNDEPVPLRAVSVRAGIIEVAGKSSARIGLPCKEVFQFTEDMFNRLSEAYQKGSQAALQALWSQAVPFD